MEFFSFRRPSSLSLRFATVTEGRAFPPPSRQPSAGSDPFSSLPRGSSVHPPISARSERGRERAKRDPEREDGEAKRERDRAAPSSTEKKTRASPAFSSSSSVPPSLSTFNGADKRLLLRAPRHLRGLVPRGGAPCGLRGGCGTTVEKRRCRRLRLCADCQSKSSPPPRLRRARAEARPPRRHAVGHGCGPARVGGDDGKRKRRKE